MIIFRYTDYSQHIHVSSSNHWSYHRTMRIRRHSKPKKRRCRYGQAVSFKIPDYSIHINRLKTYIVSILY